jgi:hypothetical protein
LRYLLGALLGLAISGGVAVAVATLTAILAPAASAGSPCTATFNNTSGDDQWTTAANWASSALPGSSDVVCFGASVTSIIYNSGSNSSVAAINGSGVTLQVLGTGGVIFNSSADSSTLTTLDDQNGGATFDGPTTITTVDVDGGVLSGSGTIAASSLDWTSGEISGGSGTINVSGSTSFDLSQTVYSWFINQYTINANDGATFSGAPTDPGFTMEGSGIINVGGTGDSDIAGGYLIQDSGGGSLAVVGSATLDDIGASGSVVTIEAPFDNNSSATAGVSIPAGATFITDGGGTSSGNFSAAAGSTLEIGSEMINGNIDGVVGSGGTTVEPWSSTINGSVTADLLQTVGSNTTTFTGGIDVTDLTVSDSTFTLNGASTTYTVTGELDLDGGVLAGSADPTAGTFDWSSGTIDGSTGKITVTGLTTITTSLATEQWYIYNEVLEASGGVTFTSSGVTDPGFELDGSAELLLDGSATSHVGGAYLITNSGGSNSVTIAADAVLDDSGGSGSTVTIQTPFDNNSSATAGVTVSAGATFITDDGGTSAGNFSAAAGSTLEIGSETINGNIDGVVGSGGTTVEPWSSTINGSVTADLLETVGSNTTTFTGGIDVTDLTVSNSTFNLNGSGSYAISGEVDLDGGVLGGNANPIAGTFDWSSGNLDGAAGKLSVNGLTTITTSLSTDQWYIYDEVLEATGGIDFTSSGITDPGVELAGSAEVLLDGTATSDIQGGYLITNSSGSNSLTIASDASLVDTGATGSTVTIQVPLDNNSSLTAGVTVPAGATFVTDGGGTSAGNFSAAAGSTLEIGSETINGNIDGVIGSGGSIVEPGASSINGSVTADTLQTEGSSTTTFSGGIDVTNLTISNSTFNLDTTSTYTITGEVDLDGGTLGGNANPIAGTFDWSSGNISGAAGKLSVTGLTTLTTSLENEQWSIYNYVLEASGGIDFTSSGITDPGVEMGGYAEILLDGTATSDIAGGFIITNSSGSNSLTIASDASLVDTGASGSIVTIQAPLDNNSSETAGVTVPAGATFITDGGGTSAGNFSAATGSTLEIGSETINGNIDGVIGSGGTTVEPWSSSINGSVTADTLETVGSNTTTFSGGIDVTNLTISNSTFNLDGAATYTITGEVDLDGGTLGGSANPSAGTFDWSSGNISGSVGKLTVTGLTTLTTSLADQSWSIYNYVLEASGGIDFTSSGITDPGVEMGGYAEILLDGTATSDIGGGYTITNSSGSNSLTIASDASLVDTGASGSIVTIQPPLDNNSGETAGVTVPSGATFITYGGGTSAGNFSAAAGSTLEIGSETINGNIDGVIGSGGTTVELWSSSINGAVTADTLETAGASTTTFTGGIDITNLTVPNSAFTLNGTDAYTITGEVDLDGGTLGGSANPTAGTFDWSSGNLSSGNGNLTVSGSTTISTSSSSVEWGISSYTLTASGGATFSNAATDPGLEINYEGYIDLAGTSAIDANEVIEASSQASLNVESGTLSIGGAGGTAQIQSAFTNAGAVTVPSSAVVDFTSTYSQSAGSTTVAASGNLLASSVGLTGGTLDGAGTISAPVDNISGTVQPGTGTTPGILTIVGSYTQAAGGTLLTNIAGATAGTGYGQLAVTTASLAGTLALNDRASFTPTDADTFDVVVAETSVSGTFATVTPSGFSATPNTNYTSTEVQVSFAAALTPTIRVTSSSSSISYGTAVTLTATVTGTGPIATGTVQFMAGSSDLGSPQALSNGVATLSTSTLPVGSLSITGVYSGDSSYKPGTSPSITVTVAKVSTTLVLEPSVTNAGAGQSVTLNAIVTPKAPSTANPTGSVTFYNGSKKIGSATLSGGVASVKTSFKAGKFTLKATYPGTSDFGSSSGTATETVVSTGSKTSITESAKRVLTAVPVKFTATVKPSSGSTVPTGDVQFYNGVDKLGKGVKLNSKGVATASYDFAHGGTFKITAAYVGTKSEGGSTSSAVSLEVQAPGYRMVGQDGGVFDFGGAGYYGSLPHKNIVPATPVVGMASTPSGLGYWLVTQGGHVYPFGDAKTYSAHSGTPSASIVAIVPTADGKGYWLIGDNGIIWRYGDAANYKDKTGLSGVVSGAATPDGKGYWIATSAGKVYAFGDAKTESAIKGQGAVSGTVSSMAPTLDGKGYYLVNARGVVYSYGDAKAYGNAKNVAAGTTITGIAESPRGTGYWIAGSDGSIYALGSAPNDGSVVTQHLQLGGPICGTSAFP